MEKIIHDLLETIVKGFSQTAGAWMIIVGTIILDSIKTSSVIKRTKNKKPQLQKGRWINLASIFGLGITIIILGKEGFKILNAKEIYQNIFIFLGEVLKYSGGMVFFYKNWSQVVKIVAIVLGRLFNVEFKEVSYKNGDTKLKIVDNKKREITKKGESNGPNVT